MTGRTALVTGAGHRLGAAIARSLSRRGYSVWVHYHRSHEAAQVLAAELRNKGGVVRTIQADLAAPGGAEELAGGLATDPPEVIVHSASFWQQDTWQTATREAWEQSHRLHGWTALVLARLLAARPGSHLITLLDARSRDPDTLHASYGFAKRELLQLTRWLALELAPSVRVNGIAPGLVLKPDALTRRDWSALAEASPLKRTGSSAQVIAALNYLLTNPGVTGQVLTVDGGRHLKGDLFGSL